MASVSSTFAAVGSSSTLFVKGGEKFRLAVTGTWVGTFRVEESRNGGQSYELVEQFTANIAQDMPATPHNRLIRLSMTAYTSGTLTYVFQNITNLTTKLKYSNVPIGQVAYGSHGTSTTPSAVLFYLTDIKVEEEFRATGIGILNAGTVGTDNILVALYDASGRLLANSDLAGVVTANAATFQQVAFLVPVTLQPGIYFAGMQCNGTTTRFRTVATVLNVDVRAGTIASVFGTVPSTIAVPTTFTADSGAVCYLY